MPTIYQSSRTNMAVKRHFIEVKTRNITSSSSEVEMASLSAARPANVMIGFPPRALIPTIDAIKLCTRASSVSSRLRFDGVTRSKVRERHVRVSATNSVSDSGNGRTPNEEDEKISKGSEGPPLLTILAGALVFLFFCWLIGSFVMWLITLIVNVASSK